MANHIIHKQTFRLAVDSSQEAHSITEAVQETYYKKVLAALDEVFTKLSPDHKIYRFEKLEIDIGHIGQENIETELAPKIITMAEMLMRDKIAAAQNNASSGEELKIFPQPESVFEAFLHFLLTGLLPWWFSDDNGKLPEKIFIEASRQITSQNIGKLISALQHEQAAVRLSTQFSEAFLNRLFLAAAASHAPGISIIKPAEKTGIRSAGLLSILRMEILSTLKKLGISNEIQQKVTSGLLHSFVADDLAFQNFPRIPDGEKLSSRLNESISKVFLFLINTFETEGFKQEEISMTISRISATLPLKSYTANWVRQNKAELIDLEKFTRQNESSASIKNKNPRDFKVAEKQIMHLAEEGIYIQNAGLVIMWPFLNYYFGQLQLLEDGDFISPEKRAHAIQLLHYISTGNEVYPEQQMALNKILCGMPLAHPFHSESEISENEKTETEILITTVIEKWEAIGRISVRGFRESFLMREGRLRLTDSGWMLKVNRNAYDMLLDRLPWGISMVKYKWMDKMIYVEW